MPIRCASYKLTLVLVVLSGLSYSCSANDDVSLNLEKQIPLPRVEGRIDHFSVDLAGGRLFIAALGNGSVEVLDLQQGKRTAEIQGLKVPQGVFYEVTNYFVKISTWATV